MATATNSIAGGPDFSLEYEYNDVTGEIQRVFWTITPNKGTLTVLIHNPPSPDVTRSVTASGSLNVPAGQYILTKSARGDWRWTGALSVETSWTAF